MDAHKKGTLKLIKGMQIRPITFKQASEFVNEHHRHHAASQGCKFCIGLYAGDELRGVAIAGRPVARKLDNGLTLEINRVCTLGDKNACSMLYGARCRIARDMGYEKVITYILASEPGTSLLASNFICDNEHAGKEHWTGVRNRGQAIPAELKKRYIRVL